MHSYHQYTPQSLTLRAAVEVRDFSGCSSKEGRSTRVLHFSTILHITKRFFSLPPLSASLSLE